jgi:hypothetical protein
MSMVTNTVSRYDSYRSVREQLSNVIYNIAPTDAVFMSNAGRGKVQNTFFEWQTDDLAAASTSNHHLEGDDVTDSTDARAATNRVGNYTQISRKIVSTTGTVEAVRQAGKKGEQAYQLAKAAKELKRDMEATLTSHNVAVVGNNTVARKTAALGAWIITNYVPGGGTVAAAPVMSSGSDGYPATALVAGTARTITETVLKDGLQDVWAAGGDVDALIVMCGPANKRIISGFNGIATRYREVEGKKQAAIIGAADLYVGDFGTVRIVPNRFQPEKSVYLVDKSLVSIQYLRSFQTIKLAKTGDADKRMLIVEYGLQVNQEKGLAHISDCTTTAS